MVASNNSRLPLYILVGAALGLLTGLALGERTEILAPLGLAYSKMLEIAVFPYLFCSLFVGLGGLARERAWRLLAASWKVYVLLWGLTFLSIFLLGAVIPPAPPPAVLLPATDGGLSDILELLIPSNIAMALDRNFVPAIVVFAALYATAMQSLPGKATLLESMEVLRRASVTIWNWIVYFAPLGVFALFASTAGTADAAVARSLAIYAALFLLGTVVLGFVILPWVLSRIVPRSHGAILAELRPALTLALVTTLSVAALPFIQKAAERLCEEEGIEGEEAGDVVKASISIAYVLSQLGNYFVALFVIFAAYHQRVALDFAQWLLLPVMTLLSGIGSPSATVDAVAFLAQWLSLPASTTGLYVETMTITRYGQVALSVIGFGFVTFTATMIYFGKARLRWRHALSGLALTVAVFGLVALGSRLAGDRLFPEPSDAAIMARTVDPDLVAQVDFTVLDQRPGHLAALEGASTFESIRRRGRLRVGYARDIPPYSYVNGAGELAGYDIAAAFRFARDLHVGIEFVPIEWSRIREDLIMGRYDIVMAGAYATPERLRTLDASEFYRVNALALIVRSPEAENFRSYQSVKRRDDLTIAVFHDPVLEPLLQSLFPKARIELLDSFNELPQRPDIDAALWTRDQATAWTEARSGYTAVVPANIGAPLPFTYLLPPRSVDMLRYVNLWLDLDTTSGERQRAIDYWIDGMPRAQPGHRWNLFDNMLLPWFCRIADFCPGSSGDG